MLQTMHIMRWELLRLLYQTKTPSTNIRHPEIVTTVISSILARALHAYLPD